MLDYKNIFSISPFSLNEKEKEKWYFDNQKKLTSYHYKNCKEYKNITNKIYGGFNKSKKLSELPFVPANLFKDFNLTTSNINDLSNIDGIGPTQIQSIRNFFLNKKNLNVLFELNKNLSIKNII